MEIKIEFTLNGTLIEVEVPPHWTLLKLLREKLGLTGTKEGCGIGECGACTVLMDGMPVNSCLVLAPKVEGRKIETIEGLGSRDSLHPLQKSFIDHGAIQCGFCTPGILMSSKALLGKISNPTRDRNQGGDFRPSLPMYGLSSNHRSNREYVRGQRIVPPSRGT